MVVEHGWTVGRDGGRALTRQLRSIEAGNGAQRDGAAQGD